MALSFEFSKNAVAVFSAEVDLQRAAKMKAYMKGQFEYFGIMATPRKALTKIVYEHCGMPDDPLACAKELFLQPQRELHYVGQEMLLKAHKTWQPDFYKEIEWFVCTKSWWDTVDFIANSLAGKFFQKMPERKEEVALAWNASSNMWLNRTAILFQLKYKMQLDTDLLTKIILTHNHSKEFFLRKSIGWVLREYGRHNPDWVIQFIGENHLEPLSRREAEKYLPAY